MRIKPHLESVGGRIRHIRSSFSREVFAEMLGIHQNTLGNYEKDERKPDSDVLTKLYELGVNPTWVLTGFGAIWVNAAPEHLHNMLEDQGLIRSKFESFNKINSETEKQNKSTSYENLDQNIKDGSEDPSSTAKHGSHSEITHSIDNKNKNNLESDTYDEWDRIEQERDLRSLSDRQMGSFACEPEPSFGHFNCDFFTQIPLYDVKASAGNGTYIDKEEQSDALIFKKEWIYSELHSNPANLYLIYVEGESMEPTLRPGDVILIDHTDNAAKRDGIYVIRMGDSLLVKRIQRMPNHILKVSSDNPAYDSFEISLTSDLTDEFSVVGRVVWSGRRH